MKVFVIAATLCLVLVSFVKAHDPRLHTKSKPRVREEPYSDPRASTVYMLTKPRQEQASTCLDVLNQLITTNNGNSASALSEACSPIGDNKACPSGCLEKVQEILTACENEMWDFSTLVGTITCYDWDVCYAFTNSLYSVHSSTLCPAADATSECGKPCLHIIDAVEGACVEADGNIPPEIFLDTYFEHPACKQYAFSKAIERSSGCNGWAKNHPIRFEDVCTDACTDQCISLIDKMLARCEDSPSFVFEDLDQQCYTDDGCLEDLRQAYKGVCQTDFEKTYISMRIENLGNFDCSEMTEFYGLASRYLCLAESNASECEQPCVEILNAVESACVQADVQPLGYVAPEVFLDSKFGNSACRELAFEKAIDRSRYCGDWAEIQSVGFDDLCSEQCTDKCVTVIGNMFADCETLPGFVVEDLVPGYNADCQKAFTCSDALYKLTATNGNSVSVLSEACSPIGDTKACPAGCLEKVQELLTACDNVMFDFSSLVGTITCYDWDVCSSVINSLYSPYSSTLCPADDSTSECGQPCVHIIDAVEGACVEPDGNIPPEFFLDTYFEHPACKQYAFSKAIERSSGCNGWAKNHPIRFEDVCTDTCTDQCISLIDKMLARCEDSPSFVFEDLDQQCYTDDGCLEDLRQAYKGVCQTDFQKTYISRGIEILGNFDCSEMTSFYGLASQYLCLADSNVTHCELPCIDILNAVESACVQADGANGAYVAPEVFLDNKFGNPSCQELSFEKAIDRSRYCGDWAEIQSVGFDYLCSEDCTDKCVTVIESMFADCETLPGFVVEDLVPSYNADCKKAFTCLDDPPSCASAPTLAPSINAQPSAPTSAPPTTTGQKPSSAASFISFWVLALTIIHACMLLSTLIE